MENVVLPVLGQRKVIFPNLEGQMSSVVLFHVMAMIINTKKQLCHIDPVGSLPWRITFLVSTFGWIFPFFQPSRPHIAYAEHPSHMCFLCSFPGSSMRDQTKWLSPWGTRLWPFLLHFFLSWLSLLKGLPSLPWSVWPCITRCSCNIFPAQPVGESVATPTRRR